ncbi:hypothetical protein J6590_040306 [Homalodisca vitripennis]|nr:hypothetical protein J6590_040306 [Homalodisca vitripennis]
MDVPAPDQLALKSAVQGDIEDVETGQSILDIGWKSRLFIANASPLYSGNYACSLAGDIETTLAVHVIFSRSYQ